MRAKKGSTKRSVEPDETEDDVTTGLGDVTLGDQPDAKMDSSNGSDDEEEEEETIPMGGGTGRVPRKSSKTPARSTADEDRMVYGMHLVVRNIPRC